MKSRDQLFLKFFLIMAIALIGMTLWGQSQDLLLQNVNYLDVEVGEFRKGSILIRDGKIQKISDDGTSIDLEITAEKYDGSGQWLIPGLVDAHIHMFQSGGLYTRPDAMDLRAIKPYEEERLWLINNAEDILRRYLRLGITTVIDVGGPMYNFRLRDQLKQPQELPNLFITGPLVSTYMPPELDVEDPPIIKANSKADAIQIIQDQLPYKPDFIKIWYISLPSQGAETNYEIIEAAIQESHKHNLKVAVHATELNTAKLAIHAGADILVHSVKDPIDVDFVKLLTDNQVVYIPTLFVHGNYDKAFGGLIDPSMEDHLYSNPIPLGSLSDINNQQLKSTFDRYQQYLPEMLADARISDSLRSINLEKLSELNITIATGTDAGNIGTLHASSYYDELDLMKKAGLSNLDIIRASTVGGAKVLNKENEIGAIQIGMNADLILLNSNPLQDLASLKDISAVIKGGKKHDPNKIINTTPEQLAQQQLNGYNARNIDAFLASYAEDVAVYNFPHELLYTGKDEMRSRYEGMFNQVIDLHCELVNRSVMGNTVIDQERVSGFEGGSIIEAMAIYKIMDGKISEVYFMSNE